MRGSTVMGREVSFVLTRPLQRLLHGGEQPRRSIFSGRRPAFPLLACTLLALLLTGCGASFSAAPATEVGFRGQMLGGQQPVSGARIYLYAVSTASNAGAATSLLNAPGYVLTDVNGNFSISYDYACPDGAYVYLLGEGGNPGVLAGSNGYLVLGSGLGACNGLTPSTIVSLNELTTVTLAYTLANYATSEIQIGASGVGALAPNFAEVGAFVDPTHGHSLPSVPVCGTAAPQAKIDSLANSLAACVNSGGSSGSTCSMLMTASTAQSGNSGVTVPSNTFQAALNIAQNPATVNVAGIYNLGTPSSPFQPTLNSAPSDWGLVTSTVPAFFSGSTYQDGNPAMYSLTFADGQGFGNFSFTSAAGQIQHSSLGTEYVCDAGSLADTTHSPSAGTVDLYDPASTHTWYTSTILYPYIYDFTLQAYLYYFVGTSNPRVFYNESTMQYVYM